MPTQNGTLTTLLSSGMDAFANLWDVIITPPEAITPQMAQSQGPYSVRANGFQPPEIAVSSYTVNYKSIQLSRPNALFEGAREFSLEFRLDSKYDLLKDLAQWKHIFFDPSMEGNIHFGALSSASTESDQKNYGTIEVRAYDSSSTLSEFADVTGAGIASWFFYDVVCTKIGTPSFTRSGSDAATVSASFIFGRMLEPGSGPIGTPTVAGANVSPTLGYKS
jgi:hypothetical protein